MEKIYKKLTEDQIERGIVFSSTLSTEKTEQDGDLIQEVKDIDQTKDLGNENLRIGLEIRLLKNDRFFNDSPWKYNIIRNK